MGLPLDEALRLAFDSVFQSISGNVLATTAAPRWQPQALSAAAGRPMRQAAQTVGFEELGALGELVGAIASVVLLAYIAIQIRHSSKNLEQNTRAVQASTRQAFTAQDQAYLCSALDPSVLAVAVAKLEAEEELSTIELSQLIGRQHVNFRVFESAFSQHQRGVFDASEWERYRTIIGFLLRVDEPARQMWAGMRELFHPDFIAEVENIAGSDATIATGPSGIVSGTGKRGV